MKLSFVDYLFYWLLTNKFSFNTYLIKLLFCKMVPTNIKSEACWPTYRDFIRSFIYYLIVARQLKRQRKFMARTQALLDNAQSHNDGMDTDDFKNKFIWTCHSCCVRRSLLFTARQTNDRKKKECQWHVWVVSPACSTIYSTAKPISRLYLSITSASFGEKLC